MIIRFLFIYENKYILVFAAGFFFVINFVKFLLSFYLIKGRLAGVEVDLNSITTAVRG
jgi:hypothetical protein